MTKVLAFIASVGTVAAVMGTTACITVIIDEPNCPQSLIK